jgi:enterochelin esterase-like enzyme
LLDRPTDRLTTHRDRTDRPTDRPNDKLTDRLTNPDWLADLLADRPTAIATTNESSAATASPYGSTFPKEQGNARPSFSAHAQRSPSA